MKSLALILGSAFQSSIANELNMHSITISTPWGEQELYESKSPDGRPIFVISRHGNPHHLLPHQINYRAQAFALQEVHCGGLLINSSVGVLQKELPLYTPMLVDDLIMPENRLPDGSTCTIFTDPERDQGHLVLNGGLFSSSLGNQLQTRHSSAIYRKENDLVFVYAGGPRSKTAAENRMWAQLGADVNSMTLAPEVVLANELGIPVAALVVGHKYSIPDIPNPDRESIRETLIKARMVTKDILVDFLNHGSPVEFGNHIYKY